MCIYAYHNQFPLPVPHFFLPLGGPGKWLRRASADSTERARLPLCTDSFWHPSLAQNIFTAMMWLKQLLPKVLFSLSLFSSHSLFLPFLLNNNNNKSTASMRCSSTFTGTENNVCISAASKIHIFWLLQSEHRFWSPSKSASPNILL